MSSLPPARDIVAKTAAEFSVKNPPKLNTTFALSWMVIVRWEPKRRNFQPDHKRLFLLEDDRAEQAVAAGQLGCRLTDQYRNDRRSGKTGGSPGSLSRSDIQKYKSSDLRDLRLFTNYFTQSGEKHPV
eukprot:scaffold225983_cov44-Prasinocladus_malaysianus.AAC.1